MASRYFLRRAGAAEDSEPGLKSGRDDHGKVEIREVAPTAS
jgi:hypothetical protein